MNWTDKFSGLPASDSNIIIDGYVTRMKAILTRQSLEDGTTSLGQLLSVARRYHALYGYNANQSPEGLLEGCFRELAAQMIIKQVDLSPELIRDDIIRLLSDEAHALKGEISKRYEIIRQELKDTDPNIDYNRKLHDYVITRSRTLGISLGDMENEIEDNTWSMARDSVRELAKALSHPEKARYPLASEIKSWEEFEKNPPPPKVIYNAVLPYLDELMQMRGSKRARSAASRA